MSGALRISKGTTHKAQKAGPVPAGGGINGDRGAVDETAYIYPSLVVAFLRAVATRCIVVGMWISFIHLGGTGWNLAVSWMGSATPGIIVPLLIMAFLELRRFLRGGWSAMNLHWKGDAGYAAIVTVIVWTIFILFFMAKSVYLDHEAMKKVAKDRWTEIHGDGGYIAQMAEMEKKLAQLTDRLSGDDAKIAALQTKLDAASKRTDAIAVKPLIERAPEREIVRDPDTIYQHGLPVAKIVAAHEDMSISSVWFDRINSTGKFDKTKEFEYRNYVLIVYKSDADTSVSFGGTNNISIINPVCRILRLLGERR